MLTIRRGRTEQQMQWIPCYKCCKDFIILVFSLSAHKWEHVRDSRAKHMGCLCFLSLLAWAKGHIYSQLSTFLIYVCPYCTWQGRGVQLEELTDIAFFVVVGFWPFSVPTSVAVMSAPTAKDQCVLENENIYQCFVFPWATTVTWCCIWFPLIVCLWI